jgi:D-sedoheptulose 7-phosphate isomerase
MSHSQDYLDEVIDIASRVSHEKIEELARSLLILREKGGRLFCMGIGGSQANADHAVNDFRKICGIEAYSPGFSEYSARANDEGLDTTFVKWLEGCNPISKDAVFIFSVGGGDTFKNVSMNLVNAMCYCQANHVKVFGVVGREGGYAKLVETCVVIIPPLKERVTAHTEAFQMVVLHCLVSHPLLQKNACKW